MASGSISRISPMFISLWNLVACDMV
jgi:hypothetical protein